jgi:protein NUD1
MTSSNTSRIYAHFPAPPILVAPPSPPPPPPGPTPRPNATALDIGAGANALLAPAVRTAASSSSPIPGRSNEDLNRFVSSSTVSGTTLTTGSSGSFVKHPGPAQITRIGPEDVPALPERVGRMVFDKVMMRWVKAAAMEPPRAFEGGGGGSAEIDAESEDPFRDIDSLREDSLVGDGPGGQASTSVNNSDVDEVGGEEEIELTSFSFDGPPHPRMHTSVSGEDNTTEDSDSDDDDVADISTLSASLCLEDRPEIAFDQNSSDEETHHEDALTVVKSTPGPSREASMPTPIRSALKVVAASQAQAVSFVDSVTGWDGTPTNKPGPRRSVSFSDGKREGPIRGLGRSTHADSRNNEPVLVGDSTFEPSARSKRIGEMLDDFQSTKKRGFRRDIMG